MTLKLPNMDMLTQLGALGAVVVVAGIVAMAFGKGMAGGAPAGASPPPGAIATDDVTAPFLYTKFSNAYAGSKGCGCGR